MPFPRRRHPRAVRFALLTLVVELAGRGLTAQLDGRLRVMPLAPPETTGYPFLLALIRACAALAVAAVAWRLVRADATAALAARLLGALARHRRRAPKIRLWLSARLWLASFGSTALWFLAQTDLDQISQGRWPLLAPWLHTFALPVFALLSVLLALGWGAVGEWVNEIERYAAASLARAYRAFGSALASPPHARPGRDRAPRQLFGLAFESRPPPLPS